jgi:hypothetical protein
VWGGGGRRGHPVGPSNCRAWQHARTNVVVVTDPVPVVDVVANTHSAVRVWTEPFITHQLARLG